MKLIFILIFILALNLPADEQIEYMHAYCHVDSSLIGCGDPQYK